MQIFVADHYVDAVKEHPDPADGMSMDLRNVREFLDQLPNSFFRPVVPRDDCNRVVTGSTEGLVHLLVNCFVKSLPLAKQLWHVGVNPRLQLCWRVDKAAIVCRRRRQCGGLRCNPTLHSTFNSSTRYFPASPRRELRRGRHWCAEQGRY